MRRTTLFWIIAIYLAVGVYIFARVGPPTFSMKAPAPAIPNRPPVVRPSPVIVAIRSCDPLVVEWAWPEEVHGRPYAFRCPGHDTVAELDAFERGARAGAQSGCNACCEACYYRGANDWYRFGAEDWGRLQWK